MATLLSQYRADVRRILHDLNTSNPFYTDTDCNNAINEARRKIVADTGCLRTLQIIYFVQGQELYTFGQITNINITNAGTGYVTAPTVTFIGGGGAGAAATATVSGGAIASITITNNGSNYVSAPTIGFSGGGGSNATALTGVISLNTLDILNVSLIWGETRYVLDWKDWSEFNAKYRFWLTQQQRPTCWAMYGESAIYIALLPDQFYQAEIDTIILPTDLVDDTSIENISLAYQSPIKYYAAYILKMKEQSFGESEWFETKYAERMHQVINEVYTRRIPSMYDDQWGY